ncbi:SCA7 domain-containing protein [Caerostris extrusa]|uniref:SCA7 domain-containing protein n=1 Tax=Caerostris extrusa TaxID=172846 RepID=A0AAV4Y6H2_CAEEX|nr:SCA7 domain-containing protein [Caerostris extrusa]
MEAAEENYDDITNLAFKELTLEIMEDAVADFCNSVHRALSYGYFPLEETFVRGGVFEVYNIENYNNECAAYLPGSDIHGNFKGGAECTNLCPVCQVRVSSSRFAPHLSNCMGFGRPRRNTIKRTTIDAEDSDSEDVDEGDNYNSKKKKKEKATRRKGRGRGNDTPQVSEANLANMSPEKLKEYLSQVFQNCGVIGRSGRFCRNSLKCSMHDDHHRREVRIPFWANLVISQQMIVT